MVCREAMLNHNILLDMEWFWVLYCKHGLNKARGLKHARARLEKYDNTKLWGTNVLVYMQTTQASCSRLTVLPSV
jgi:hypothetical protein